MTHEQRIEWCKVCLNRKMDPRQGLICSITGIRAAFETACDKQEIDETEREHLKAREAQIESEEAGHPTDYMRNIKMGIFFILLGLVVMISSFFFPIMGVVAVVPYGIIAYGVAVLVRGLSQKQKLSENP